MADGNTWLPAGDSKDAWQELSQYRLFSDNVAVVKKQPAIILPANKAVSNDIFTKIEQTNQQNHALFNYSKVNSFSLVCGILLIAVIIWGITKNRYFFKILAKL